METHTCLNCSNTFSGKYCNNCGEKVYTKHDKSMGHLLEEVLHFLTHFEGKFFQSLKAIFTKPGLMSYDYCRGLRKKYFKPVSLYIFLVVLYLLFPLVQGLNMPLQSYLGQKYYGRFASNSVEKKLDAKRITMEELSHRFAKKSEKVSKVMLLVILPLCAFVLMSLWRNKKGFYFFDHFILSAEINSFFLIFLFFIIPPIIFILSLFFGRNFESEFLNEEVVLCVFIAVMIPYLILTFQRMYAAGFWQSLIKAIVFCAMQLLIVFYIYKFLLFSTVMLFV